MMRDMFIDNNDMLRIACVAQYPHYMPRSQV